MEKSAHLTEFLKSSGFCGSIQSAVPLSEHTTFKIGGCAGLFLEPSDTDSLALAVRSLQDALIPFFVLGGGSNVVFSDIGFQGAVISTAGLAGISLQTAEKSSIVKCGAGMPTNELVEFCTKHGIPGAESFAGLPGSVGGAVFMNARCFGKSFSEILASVSFLDTESGAIKNIPLRQEEWGYKKSPFQSGKKIILAAELLLSRPDASLVPELQKRAQDLVHQREEKGHFKYPSAGSVFKNNRSFGKPSGLLIDESGLKGHSLGGAQIAPWHGNFIINTGRATATDVKGLVQLAVTTVQKKTGFVLEPEIIFVD